MRRTVWTHARSLGLALLWGWCLAWALPARAQQSSSPDIIDDVTTYSFSKIADFTPITLPVTRTFPRKIKRLQLTITGGSADDLGYVGGKLVTSAPGCGNGIGQVTSPVDVTDQVTVDGNTASFTLTAVETCCCYTGWGGATLHWQVELEPEVCTEQVCSAQCASDAPDLFPTVSASWNVSHLVDCGALGGKAGFGLKAKAGGSYDPAQCSGDCKSTGKVSGELEGEVQLCGLSRALTGALEYAGSTEYDKTCNWGLCGMHCDPESYCSEGSGAFSAKVDLGRASKELKLRIGSRGSRAFAVDAKCTAKVNGSVEAKGSTKEQENHGSSKASCRNCDGISGELSLSGGGSAGCKLDVSVAGMQLPIECSTCAELKLGANVKGVHDTCGEDGARNCGSGAVSVAAKLGADVCLDLKGMRIKGAAHGTYTDKCEADSCAGKALTCDPKSDFSANFSIGLNTKC